MMSGFGKKKRVNRFDSNFVVLGDLCFDQKLFGALTVQLTQFIKQQRINYRREKVKKSGAEA